MIDKTEAEITANWKYAAPPLVSCCCTTFNHKGFIGFALDSMLMQETEFPFEILVRDDCSQDGTSEILRQYSEKFPSIIQPFFEKQNQFSKGVRPLPELLKHTNGSYIAILEGDDYWRDPQKLQLQADFLEKNSNYVVSHHDSQVVDTANRKIRSHLYENLSDYDGEQLVCMEAHLITGSVMFRSSAYKHMSIFDSAYNGDTVIWHQLGFHGKAKYQPEIIPSAYRIHPGGIWSSRNKIQRFDHAINTRLLIKKNLSENIGLMLRAQRQIDNVIAQELINYTKSADFILILKIFQRVFKNTELSVARIIPLYFMKLFMATGKFTKTILQKITVIGRRVISNDTNFLSDKSQFAGSREYWNQRYLAGGNSGPGSYNNLARFKSEVINCFVNKNNIQTVLEFGCGDGNQLRHANYPSYLGFDISGEALKVCRKLFSQDNTKEFKHLDEYNGEHADLTLSLDVIFHLVEDSVFDAYMRTLLSSATSYCIIYSSNSDNNDRQPTVLHVRHRKFTDWITQNRPDWKLVEFIPNKFPYEDDQDSQSFADFYIYKKC